MSNRLIAWVVLSGLALFVPLVLAAQLTSAAPATATFNVESTLDEPDFNPGDGFCVSTPSGTCTLRAAIMEANRVTTQDVTIMLPAGIYSITVPFSGSNSDDTGDFNLLPPNANSPLITIQGAGAATTILDGNGLDRLFTVHLNRQASLKDVTLRGGKVPGSVGGGLYIVSGGSLTLTDVTLSGNQSDIGGGIYNAGALVVMRSSVSSNSAKYGAGIDSVGPLTIMSSTLAYNTAITGGGALNVNAVVSINSSQFYGNSASTNDGGAIRIESPGSVTISGSQITANHAPARSGGGIMNEGVLTVTQSTLSGNSATYGGGIYVFGPTTLNNVTLNGNSAAHGGGVELAGYLATLTNSTLSSNPATVSGGGMEIDGGTATLTNVTLSGNSAGYGGGIANFKKATLTNVTLSGNSATYGGGIGQQSDGPITLKNTIIANSPAGGNCYQSSGSPSNITSNGNNLSDDPSCASYFTKTGDPIADWNSANANLGPLANNGGFTLTHLPLLPNVGIDHGDACGSPDQRGVTRPQGSRCDIGAVEYRAGEVTPWLYLPLIVR